MVRKITPPPPAGGNKTKKKERKKVKSFSVATWDGEGQGEKIILYGASGMGKTTLASMTPNPVFIGLDDGGRKLTNPKTGKPLKYIPNVEDFYDVRAVLQKPEILDGYDTIVIDQITELESMAEPWVFENRIGPKGKRCSNLTEYGFNKGWSHLYDAMKLILADANHMIQAGKNVVLIAQETGHKVANPGGEDFLRAGPRLYSGNPSIEAVYVEWADHVLRIDYNSMSVEDRKASSDDQRVIQVQPKAYYRAKSRTMPSDTEMVWFETPDDDSIWRFLFDEAESD